MPAVPLRDPRPPLIRLELPVEETAQSPLPFADEPELRCLDDAATPQERAAVLACVRLLFEGLAGARPLGPLERLTTTPVLAVVAAGARRRHRLRGRSIRIGVPRDGVYEVAVRASPEGATGDVAVALRLERRGGQLICTALDLGPSRRASLRVV